MTKRQIEYFILVMIIGITFLSCDLMATLFHGEKPPDTYTVTFNANGAIGTPPAEQTVNAGTVIRLPDKGGMSSTGNIFVGWNESSSGGGTTYSVGASIKVTRDMVFYAQWLDGSTPQYTVTFNANGATSGLAPASQTVYRGISITVPGQGTLSFSGKTFGGWNTQSNGGGTNYEVGAIYTVTDNVTLYAKWQSVVQYTVTYHANGASGVAPTAQTVDPGTEITLPGVGSMTNIGKMFEGWNTQANGGGISYAEGAAYTVNGNITLYAKWVSVPITPPGATLAEQLAYICNYTGSETVFDIVVNNNESLVPTSVDSMGLNITVIIRSVSSEDVKTIQLLGQGHLFSIDTGITLKLQDIVLRGHSTNNKALVAVGQGKLILDSGAKITMNSSQSSSQGGGVYVGGGILEMNEGAEISGNNHRGDPSYGGGIYVINNGSVVLRGGLISENSVEAATWANRTSGCGGGIYIGGNSTVIMTGGIISKNSCKGYMSAYGGGVYVGNGSTFTKQPASGSSTSGIIYGSTGNNANTCKNGDYNAGFAVYRGFGSVKIRNNTLGPGDEITTLSDVGWE